MFSILNIIFLLPSLSIISSFKYYLGGLHSIVLVVKLGFNIHVCSLWTTIKILNFWYIILYYSWPANQDVKPKDYLNKGGRVTVFALKPETPLICAVEQLASYLEKLNVKIVIKVDNHFLDDVTSAFEKTSIKDRVSWFLLHFFPINLSSSI